MVEHDPVISSVLNRIDPETEIRVDRKGSKVTIRIAATLQVRSDITREVAEAVNDAEYLAPCSRSGIGSIRTENFRYFIKPPCVAKGCANDSGNENIFEQMIKRRLKEVKGHPEIEFFVPDGGSYRVGPIVSCRRVSRSKEGGVSDFSLKQHGEKRLIGVSIKKSTSSHYSCSSSLYAPIREVMDDLLERGVIHIDLDEDGEPIIRESALAFPLSRELTKECLLGGVGKGLVIWGDFARKDFVTIGKTIRIRCDRIITSMQDFFDQGLEMFAMVRRSKGRNVTGEQFYKGLRVVTYSRDRLVGNYTIFNDIMIGKSKCSP